MATPLHPKRLAVIAAALLLAWAVFPAWAVPGDPDGDGLPTQVELSLRTDPNDPSTGPDPLNADSDNDGLLDGAEVYLLNTNPMRDNTDGTREIDSLEDYDGDGFCNGAELANGSNPLAPNGIEELKIIKIDRTRHQANASTGVSTPISIPWTEDEAFPSYAIQFDADPTFATPVEVTHEPSLTEASVAPGSAKWKLITREGRLIYARVLGVADNERRFSSDITSFTITGGPAPLSPIGQPAAAWDPALVPTFSWAATGNRFRITITSREKLLTGLVASPADGTFAAFTAISGGRSWTPSRKIWRKITSLGRNLMWQVTSRDLLGRYAFSEWSELTLSGGATAGTASIGTNETAGPDTIPTFYFRPGNGASRYRFLFSGSGDFSARQVVKSTDATRDFWPAATDYKPDATQWNALTALGPKIYWLVQGWNPATRIYTSSDVFSYDLGTNLLFVEGMESAGLNGVLPTALPTITLAGPVGATATTPWQDFQVTFAGVPQPVGEVVRDPADSFLTGNIWAMNGELPAKIASLEVSFPYLIVRGRTASGNSFFSPAYPLASSAYMRAPVLDNAGAAVEPTERYTISWNRSPDDRVETPTALFYELQEATDINFTANLKSFDIEGTSRNFRHSAITETTVFYYRVRAVNSVGHSAWSNVDKKKIVPAASNWSPNYTTTQPFSDGGDNYVIDDAQNNSRGSSTHWGPGWVSRVEAGAGSYGYMGDYHYITSLRGPNGTEGAAWIPKLAKAGIYEVWVAFFVTFNRDDHVEYFVDCASGTYGPFAVSQWTSGHTGAEYWVKLGEFRFDAGTAGKVLHQFSAVGRSYSEEIDVAAFKWVRE